MWKVSLPDKSFKISRKLIYDKKIDSADPKSVLFELQTFRPVTQITYIIPKGGKPGLYIYIKKIYECKVSDFLLWC